VSRPWLSLAAAIIAVAWPVCAGAQATFVKLPTETAVPLGIAPGADGNLWVTEHVGNKIAQITPSGTVTEFKVPTAASGPDGITPGPDGNLWFTELTDGKIGRITIAGGITEFPIPSGNGAGPITAGPDGNLWFGEPTGNMVGRITTAGVITEFPLPTESGLGGPTGIAPGPDGTIWVALPGLNSIGRITTDGSTTNVFPIPTATSGAQGIAQASDGNLYFTESNTDKIGQVTPTGTITEFPLPAGTTPLGIAPGPQGTMWFTAVGSNSLYQMILPLPPPLTNGVQGSPTFTQFILPQSCGPSAIAPGPLTFPVMAFSCADTTLNSIGEMLPPANVTLTVALLGNANGRVTSIPGGINCDSGDVSGKNESCSASFPSGQQVVLAPSATPGTAAFAGWNLPPAAAVPGCGGTSQCQLSLTADTTVSATFNPALGTKELSVTLGGFNLVVFSAPPGILCSSLGSGLFKLCSNTFPTGTVVTLNGYTALDNNIAFAGWSGGGCTATRACTITLLADTEVTAMVGPATSGGSIPANAAAATLPTNRNVSLENVMVVRQPATTGGAVTVFGTMINALSVTATNCAVQPSPLANLPGAFVYQTTDPATNALTGTANTPVNIAAGAAQSFVLAFTPTLPFASIDVPLVFSCANLLAAPSVPGLDTVLLAASITPVPDVIALGATATNDQTLHITGSTGSGAFAVATINLGAGASITVAADTGGSNIPVSINLCQTDPQSGQCISAIGPSVTTQINTNDTPTFGIFVTALDTVGFDPTNNRIFVSFFDAGGVQRGGTSVAVETQ
jgi:streptogramin lyase